MVRLKRSVTRGVALVAMTILVGCQMSPVDVQGRRPAVKPPASSSPVVSQGPVEASSNSEYIVLFKQRRIPSDFAAWITTWGGTVLATLDGIGAVVVAWPDASRLQEMASYPEVEGVAPNLITSLPDLTPTGNGGMSAPSKSSQKPSSKDTRPKPGVPGDDELEDILEECDDQEKPFDPEKHIPPVPFGPPDVFDFVGPEDPKGPSREPFSGYQWNLRTTRAAAVWCQGFTGKGALVSVIDSGIDPDHPDLQPNLDLARSISFVPGEPSIVDVFGHGTQVTGVLASAQNHFGISGIAPDATFFAVKVFNPSGDATLASVLLAMLYSADQGADVMNMSLNFFTANPTIRLLLELAVDYARERNTIVVNSAGNNAVDLDTFPLDSLPAEIPEVVTVSAVGPFGQKNFDTFEPYSNFGSAIDLAAPGGTPFLVGGDKRDLILTTRSSFAPAQVPGSTHIFSLGTSIAAPHVAGAVAVLRQAFPNASIDEIERRLFETADDLVKKGKDPFFGHGRLNLGLAVFGSKKSKHTNDEGNRRDPFGGRERFNYTRR